MKYLSLVAGAVAVTALILLASGAIKDQGKIYTYVEDGWSLTLGNKVIANFSLKSFDKFNDKKSIQRASALRDITFPRSCSVTPCYLFLGEVGDISKVFIDGNLLKSQGYADGNKTLANHVPLIVEIPLSFVGKHKIRVEIESLFGINFGFQRGPYFIGDYAATRYHERFLLLSVVNSALMQALVLAILGILGLVSWRLARMNQSVLQFAIFCLAEAFFMVCFSFIPREYLPVGIAGFVHYFGRISSDWALFEFLNCLFPYNKVIRKIFRLGFASSLFAMLAVFIFGSGFLTFVTLCKVSEPLIIGSPLIALISSIRLAIKNRFVPAQPHQDLPILIPTLVFLLFCQVWDTSVFLRLFSGPYMIKFYLAPLTMMFAIVLVRRFFRTYEGLLKSKSDSERDSFLGQLAIEFSHDLKSPLNALKASADIAIEANDPEYSKKVLGDVARRTADVTNRLQELFEYSRDNINNRKAIDLRVLGKQILEELRPQALSKNIILESAFPSEEFCLCQASIKRAIINLVQNSIDASSSNGTIKIVAAIEAGKLLIEVKDTGKGIDPSDIPHVFDPYFTKGKSKGTGLGLAIVDRILRQHGGSVQVFSKLNQGSTFIMEIPQ